MLVVINNEHVQNWRVGDYVPKINYRGDLVIAIDPSKTNMAVMIGNPFKDVFIHLEFSGNNRKKGPTMDTTDYCQELREYFRTLLRGHSIMLVGVESTITKKGMEHHHSNAVLKELDATLKGLFIDDFKTKVIPVNNWSWKASMLPEGYRGMYEKGSSKWFARFNPESPYNFYYESDMTDVYFIFYYLLKTECQNVQFICNRSEKAYNPYQYAISPLYNDLELRECIYNDVFTLDENLSYFVNRLTQTFKIRVPLKVIQIEDIYERTYGFVEPQYLFEYVWVVACQKS